MPKHVSLPRMHAQIDDPHQPKSTEELDKETRAAWIQAARNGKVDVLGVQRSWEAPADGAVQPRPQNNSTNTTSAVKAAAAIARHQQRSTARGKSDV